MTAILVSWAISAALLVLLAVILGTLTKPAGPFGILLDTRGRFSLTHLQLILWSLVVLSLISGVFWGRLVQGVTDPLGFTIPGPVLGLMGITIGSAVTSGVVKASKDAGASAASVAASNPEADEAPRWGQIFLLEEGAEADSVVDVTKFQNFVITLVLVVAYVALAIHTIVDAKVASAVTTLPTFSGSFVILLGISHAGYIAGKIPSPQGQPDGLTVANRERVLSGLQTITPRNKVKRKPTGPAPLAKSPRRVAGRVVGE